MPKQSAIRKTAIWFYFALFALLLTPSPIQAYAQEGDGSKPGEERSSALAAENVRFEHLTTEHGLSNNRVVSILKDSQGFMWFGTFDGLNRFDGNQFKVFKHIIGDESSLSANVILALHEDRDGSIWIGTSGGGLNRFDPETEQFTRYRHDPDDPLSLGSDTVFVIYQDRQGNLWIGTGGGGLNRYDPQADFFVRYQHDPDDPHSLSDDTVRSVFEDRQGVLWVGTEGGGLNRFDRQRERFTTYRHDLDDPHSLGNDSVAVIYEDSAGALWVGLLGGGLDRLDRETERFIHHRHDPENPFSLSHNVVASLYEDPAGKLWVSTGGGGLNLLDPQTGQFTRFQPNPDDPYSLSHSNSQFIYGDQTGLLWIGSTGGGVDKLDLGRKPFAHYRSIPGNPDSLSSNDVLGIYEDDEGVLWIGTSSGGLNRLDRHTKQVTRYMHDPEDPHSLSHNLVREIVQDQAGMLWLATRGGVNRFDQQTDQFVIYLHDPADPSSLLNDNVMTIRVDQAGVLWIGTWTGLNSLDPRTGESISYQHILSDPNSSGGITVIAIYEDQAGVLWLGTFGDGLVRFDPQTERVTHYLNDEDDLHSLNDNTVFAINEDRAGTLWVGTSSGLDRFDRDTGGFIHYGEKDGLPAAGVLGILEDDLSTNQGGPNLWLSTSLGLSRFNPQTGSVRNYDASDGLQGDEFSWGSAFKSKAGELFFGGTNGLTAFYPSQIIDNPHIPPVVITDFQLANKPVELGEDSVLKQPITETDQLTLTYEDRVISFEFAALNYRAPEKNRYRYMLEGFDEEWTEVGSDRRFVTYTNLDPGAYIFSVIGSNNDGVWNEEGASLAITITPPWWQTNWFRGGVFLLLVGLVAGTVVWQRRNARTREQVLEAQVVERTHELQESEVRLRQAIGAMQEANQQLTALQEISYDLSSVPDLSALLDRALGHLNNAVDFDRAAVMLADDEHSLTTYAFHSAKSWPAQLTIVRIPIASMPPFRRVYEQRAAVYIPDLMSDQEAVEAIDEVLDESWAAALGEMKTWLGVPLMIEDQVIGVLSLLDAQMDAYQPPARNLIQIFANQAAIAIHNAELYQRLRKSLDDLDTVLTVSTNIVSMLDLKDLLNLILSQLKQVIEYDGAGVLTLKGDILEFQSYQGVSMPVDLLHLKINVDVLPQVRTMVSTQKPFIIDDVYQEPALSQTLYDSTGQPVENLFGDTRSWMCFPMIVKDVVIGMLAFVHLEPGYYKPEVLSTLQIFANQAAVAIENARLYVQAQDVAVDSERQRLARELHDSVTQSLYTSSLIAEALPSVWQSHPEEALRSLEDLRKLTQGALAEMRTLLLELRPDSLADRQLGELLRQLTDAMSARTDLPITTTVTGDHTVPPEVQITFYRIAQETLNNISKHARATNAWVNLYYSADELFMRIRDNGRGFDPGAVEPHQLGLNIMHERAQAIGATLTIKSQSDQGTEILVRWHAPSLRGNENGS